MTVCLNVEALHLVIFLLRLIFVPKVPFVDLLSEAFAVLPQDDLFDGKSKKNIKCDFTHCSRNKNMVFAKYNKSYVLPIYSFESCNGSKESGDLSSFSIELIFAFLSDEPISTKLSPNAVTVFLFVSVSSIDVIVSLFVSEAK